MNLLILFFLNKDLFICLKSKLEKEKERRDTHIPNESAQIHLDPSYG